MLVCVPMWVHVHVFSSKSNLLGSSRHNPQEQSIIIDCVVCTYQGCHTKFAIIVATPCFVSMTTVWYSSLRSPAAHLITSQMEHAESVIGKSLLAFCPQGRLLTSINWTRKKLMDFYWWRTRILYQTRISSKTEAFNSGTFKDNTATQNVVEDPRWVYSVSAL